MKDIEDVLIKVSRCTTGIQLKRLLDTIDIEVYHNNIVLEEDDWVTLSSAVITKLSGIREEGYVNN